MSDTCHLIFFPWGLVFCDSCIWCCYSVVDEPCYPYTAGSGFLERCRLPKRANLLTARCNPPAHPQTVFRTDLYRMGPAYRLGSEQDIMYEIMESGPVQGTTQHLALFLSESGMRVVFTHFYIEDIKLTHCLQVVYLSIILMWLYSVSFHRYSYSTWNLNQTRKLQASKFCYESFKISLLYITKIMNFTQIKTSFLPGCIIKVYIMSWKSKQCFLQRIVSVCKWYLVSDMWNVVSIHHGMWIRL